MPRKILQQPYLYRREMTTDDTLQPEKLLTKELSKEEAFLRVEPGVRHPCKKTPISKRKWALQFVSCLSSFKHKISQGVFMKINALFFPRVILLCLYRQPQPNKTQKAPNHKLQRSSTEDPNPTKPNPRPQPRNPKPPFMSKIQKREEI